MLLQFEDFPFLFDLFPYLFSLPLLHFLADLSWIKNISPYIPYRGVFVHYSDDYSEELRFSCLGAISLSILHSPFGYRNCRFLSDYLVKQWYSSHCWCCFTKTFSKRLKENGKQIGTVCCITLPSRWSMRRSRSRIKLCLCRQRQRERKERTRSRAGTTETIVLRRSVSASWQREFVQLSKLAAIFNRTNSAMTCPSWGTLKSFEHTF